ncbi:hypothetical protein [Streptomyces niveus]|uniref:hypothetical protein n=1 Tax=Streptomyces niveus TaxID=193462 RepID=UPI0036F185A2
MAAHPGTTLTKLYASGPNLGRTRPARHEALVERLARWGLVVRSVHTGLLPPLYAATSPEATSVTGSVTSSRRHARPFHAYGPLCLIWLW